MRATILPWAVILTKAHRAAGQYDGQGVYCGLSIVSEVFLIYSCQCNYETTFP